jgi:hypothetical protein
MAVGGAVGYMALGPFGWPLHGNLVHGFQSLLEGLQEFLEILPEDDNRPAIKSLGLGWLAFHNGQEKIAHPVFLHIEEITTAFTHDLAGKYLAPNAHLISPVPVFFRGYYQLLRY